MDFTINKLFWSYVFYINRFSLLFYNIYKSRIQQDDTNFIYSIKQTIECKSRQFTQILKREMCTVITLREGGCSMQTGRRGNSRACAPRCSRQYSCFKTFTARVFECISIPLERGKRIAVFGSECSVKSRRPAYPL